MKKTIKLETILANNLTQLMATTAGLDTIDKVSQRSGLGRGTVERVRKATVSTKIETVEMLAAAFGLPAIQLLSEGLEIVAAANDAVGDATVTLPAGRAPTSMQWVNADEDELLTNYRTTDDEGRRTIKNISSIVPKVLFALVGKNQAE